MAREQCAGVLGHDTHHSSRRENATVAGNKGNDSSWGGSRKRAAVFECEPSIILSRDGWRKVPTRFLQDRMCFLVYFLRVFEIDELSHGKAVDKVAAKEARGDGRLSLFRCLSLPTAFMRSGREVRPSRPTFGSITLTVAARFNKDSHRSPTMPKTHTPAPVMPSHAGVILPRENDSSGESTPNEKTSRDSKAIAGPAARAVAVPREIAPVTPTQVLFGLAMARILGTSALGAALAAVAGESEGEGRARSVRPCLRLKALKIDPARSPPLSELNTIASRTTTSVAPVGPLLVAFRQRDTSGKG